MPALEIPTVDQRTLSKYLIRQIQVHKVAKKNGVHGLFPRKLIRNSGTGLEGMEKMLMQQLKVIFVEEYFILSLISYLMLC